MKIISEKVLKSGKRRVVVDIEPGNALIEINHMAHYKLGSPLDEVFYGSIIADAVEVNWCSVEQEWKP